MHGLATCLFTCLTLALISCDGNTDGDAGDSDVGEETGDIVVTCKLVDTVALADGDEVAPNGRTGAEIVAALPESFQTTLHWDLSNSSVEVEVAGAAGPSSSLDLGFSLSPNPAFYFEDWVAVDPDGNPAPGSEVICDDYVQTSLALSAHTMDSALSIDLTDAKVRLGPDHPEFGVYAAPFVQETASLSSPDVTFISPVAQPADSDKNLTIIFDGQSISGTMTVYATTSNETHQIVVARW